MLNAARGIQLLYTCLYGSYLLLAGNFWLWSQYSNTCETEMLLHRENLLVQKIQWEITALLILSNLFHY